MEQANLVATTKLGLERNVFVMGVSSMVATFGAYTWLYFLPLYYHDTFDASAPVIGIIYTVWMLMIGLGAAPAGALADKYGRKIIVVIAGMISASGVFILAYSHSLILAAIAFPLTGLGTSFLSVSNVMIAESVEARKRGSAFGTFQAFSYALPSLSPIIGGFSLLNSQTVFFPLLIFGGVMVLVATGIRAFFSRETLFISETKKPQKKKESYFHNISSVFRNRVLLVLIVVYSFYNLLVDQGSYILPLYGQYQLALNTMALGVIFAVILFISAVARIAFGRLSDRIGNRKMIMVSWLGESSTIFIFVFSPRGDLYIALAGITFWALFGVMDGPAVNSWLANVTETEHRGLSMGSFYSAAFLVAVPFFSLAGFLYSMDPRLPFYANSILGICALIALMTFTRDYKKIAV